MCACHHPLSNVLYDIKEWKGNLIHTHAVYLVDLAAKNVHSVPDMFFWENSKILMYDFFYNHNAKYGPNCELIYTDTDSLLLDIQTEDIYKDMARDSYLYDTSNYPEERKLHRQRHKQKRSG